MSAPALIVIAKAPQAGQSKTRLCPPCTPELAAELAEAALRDTLAAVAATPCSRRVLALDGAAGDWLAPGFDLVAQRGQGLAERVAGAFEDVGGPALVIAMDTPQVSPHVLTAALEALSGPGTDAVLGPTTDGGYWAVGVRSAQRRAFEGVPMSSPQTHAAQAQRLRSLGLRTVDLPAFTDVDSIADARLVARLAPATLFAAKLRASGLAGDDGEPVAEAAA